jgi:hypothetical protein
MSTIEVNKITPVSGGTTVQVGESGDTINIPAGATIANAGTATGFGVSLANGADNRVVTASSASALNGEANLRFDGSTVRVGSGTTSPASDGSDVVVEGSGNTGISILSGGTNSANLYFGTNGANNDGLIRYDNDGNNLKFYTNASEAMRIDSNGQLLINTTSTVSNDSVLQVVGNSNTTASTWKINGDGNIALLFRNSAGDSKGSIVINANSTAYNTSSDYRLKENVDYTFDATTRLKQLKPARFNWISDETNTLIDGFIAHEVSSVIPEAVNGDKDEMVKIYYQKDDEIPEDKKVGDFKEYSTTEIQPQGIDQAKIVPLLTKALQEAITKIETLEAKVAVLESA